jgi:hypothetical protein
VTEGERQRRATENTLSEATPSENTLSGKHTEWKNTPSGRTHRAEEHTERAEEHTELKTHRAGDTLSKRQATEREGVGNRASELRGEQGTLLQALPEGLVATTGLIYNVV